MHRREPADRARLLLIFDGTILAIADREHPQVGLRNRLVPG